MPNLTAIGLYANGMPFCVTAEIDNHKLVQKVMDIVFNDMAYTVYKGYIASVEEKYKQALKFTLLDLAKHHLHRDFEVEYRNLMKKKITEERMHQTNVYYGITLADLKERLHEARKSLGLALDADADGSLALSLQNKIDALGKARQQTDLEYNMSLKMSIIDDTINVVSEKIKILTKYITACETTQL
jgi:hypothetical protein